MRRIKYFVASSLDSYISRKDGGVDWLFKDQCRSNLFQQIPSRIPSPCSRQMPGPSFGPNSWNGTGTTA
jgi:hypothetical protein